ncbi:MAG TPA: hypothetical protein VLH79_10530 [Chthonomonadales bacterium]|nr:hypothetical protein [Chthonomonadales bacterium]
MAVAWCGVGKGRRVRCGERSEVRRRAIWRELGVYAALIALIALLDLQEPSFCGGANLQNVLAQIALMAIVSVGMTAVIPTGGISLSVGSIAALDVFPRGMGRLTVDVVEQRPRSEALGTVVKLETRVVDSRLWARSLASGPPRPTSA